MAHYDNVGNPTMQTLNCFWFDAEQPTKNGWLRRGSVLDAKGKEQIATLVEFNGPQRNSGEMTGLFQIVEVTPDNGDTYVQYQLVGVPPRTTKKV